jgi:ubiquinone/menaquinone biosynthesis C-methylase UbiE
VFSYIFMKILEAYPQTYDRRMDKLSGGQVKRFKEAVVAEIPRGAHVLEIGCGTGELAEMMIAKGATVAGIDSNPLMAEKALERIKARDLKDKLTIQKMDIDGMDGFPSSTFDTVVSTLVFSELSGDERRFALKQSYRVLKPGGLFIIADEVVPRKAVRKILQAFVRLPLLAITYLVTRTATHPIPDLRGELETAGFTIQKEVRSRGDTFALVVASYAFKSTV